MNVTVARTFFERSAVKAGLRLAGVSSASGAPAWTSRALGQKSELRLSWKSGEEQLSLEISHGAHNHELAGWLLVFGEQCPGGNIPASQDNEPPFESAVAYGLELMAPQANERDA
jgi:hypothetical protein